MQRMKHQFTYLHLHPQCKDDPGSKKEMEQFFSRLVPKMSKFSCLASKMRRFMSRSQSLNIMGDISHHQVDHCVIFHDYHPHPGIIISFMSIIITGESFGKSLNVINDLWSLQPIVGFSFPRTISLAKLQIPKKIVVARHIISFISVSNLNRQKWKHLFQKGISNLKNL